ncbi:BatA domain-containing protein [Adhaeretor mobilis]|uniref:VWFA domain-containing protein n=1 Tax=Adhaeretor mobilis TaxID=1930276 RepID=A0A517MX33_9BACT|nr:BatA domain-containing protein [Adhaeretor mobilis]QDS99431.1 hypothetical protein HG15A2_27540 [Adhaeretor mobilis]
MTYLFPTLLTFGLPLLALPVLIHLINLRRRQRVEWAAMDFLLESQKRNKKWVVLRQLLLLLLRTAAIALVVGMLASPVIRPAWAKIFGAGMKHHVLLLDDSYSMTDQWGETSAFEEAKKAIERLLSQSNAADSEQVVTILRFSEAERLSVGSTPEIYQQKLNAKLLESLQEDFAVSHPNESNAGPVDALEAALRMPETAADETRIAYLVSDFRKQQWQEETQLSQLVQRYRAQVSHLRLIQCVGETRDNLAVTRLEPESGIRATGVETWYVVEVANYGDTPANEVTVTVQADRDKLPAIQLGTIEAGEDASQRFRVTYETAGPHQLTASLEPDAVALDNVRYFAAQVPKTIPLLLIDSSPRGDDGYFLETALSPGEKNLAGWSPQIERASFLRQHDQLDQFAAIFLLDVPKLDQTEVDVLEAYVERGGGLGIFLGEQTRRQFYNESLYRDGEGLLPAPLDIPTQLLRDSDSATADVEVSDHPLFSIFSGQRNSFLKLVRVEFYFALLPEWQPEAAQPLAKLRNGAPLIMEKGFGEGRVVMQLCKLSPKSTDLGVWSNWGLNPMFPIYANELAGYLTAAKRQYHLLTSGDVLEVVVPESDYQGEAEIIAPDSAVKPTVIIGEANEQNLTFKSTKPTTSGVWRFDLQPIENREDVAATPTRVIAVNVPRGEGDLHTLQRGDLAELLDGIDYEFLLASSVAEGNQKLAGYPLRDLLFWGLLATLAIEQLVAVAASYHGRVATRRAIA